MTTATPTTGTVGNVDALVAAATRVADAITSAGLDGDPSGEFARVYAAHAIRVADGQEGATEAVRALDAAIDTGAVDHKAASFARSVADRGTKAYRRVVDPAAARRADVDAREACVRCGGSGQYAQHGDCFRCGGNGVDPKFA